MEKNKKVIMWDDINLFMHKIDSIEKINEDAKLLIKGYIKDMGEIKSDLISIRNFFRYTHLKNAFQIQFIMIFQRFWRLNK